MRQRQLLGLAILVCCISPAMLLCQENCQNKDQVKCQDDSNKQAESYNGEPLCPSRRGVYPHPTYQPDPEYDNKARKKKIQGTVFLSMIVTKEGSTADIKVVKSLTPGLDAQAVKAVSRWRFEPVVYEGKTCPMKVNAEVAFRLY